MLKLIERVASNSTNSNGESVPAGLARISEIRRPGPACANDFNPEIIIKKRNVILFTMFVDFFSRMASVFYINKKKCLWLDYQKG
jgi:hypothetical protein